MSEPKQSHTELLNKISTWRRQSLKGVIYTKSLGWKRLASKKGIPYKISNKEIHELYEFQAGRCYLTGVVFPVGNFNIKETVSDPLASANTMTLIRKDPNLPYEVGNVILVTYQAAQAVGLWGIESMLDMCYNAVGRHFTTDQIRGLCG